MENKDVLLRVENLRQYFKTGKNDFKAVDDISFEIKKGEVSVWLVNQAVERPLQVVQSLSFILRPEVMCIIMVNG